MNSRVSKGYPSFFVELENRIDSPIERLTHHDSQVHFLEQKGFYPGWTFNGCCNHFDSGFDGDP
jgi:hypothetical protein